jgi:hypothetical protein
VFTSPLHRNGMYVYSRGGPPTAPAPRPSLIYCALHRNGSVRVEFPRKLFTESLPSNEGLLWLRYAGFQASCHNTINFSSDLSEIRLETTLRKVSSSV